VTLCLQEVGGKKWGLQEIVLAAILAAVDF